jgi:hypothetical protein
VASDWFDEKECALNGCWSSLSMSGLEGFLLSRPSSAFLAIEARMFALRPPFTSMPRRSVLKIGLLEDIFDECE